MACISFRLFCVRHMYTLHLENHLQKINLTLSFLENLNESYLKFCHTKKNWRRPSNNQKLTCCCKTVPTLPGIEILLQEAIKPVGLLFGFSINGLESSSPLISIFSSEDINCLAHTQGVWSERVKSNLNTNLIHF